MNILYFGRSKKLGQENYLEKLSKKIKNTSAKFHKLNNNYQILISIYNKAIKNNKIISNKK